MFIDLLGLAADSSSGSDTNRILGNKPYLGDLTPGGSKNSSARAVPPFEATKDCKPHKEKSNEQA